MSSTKHTHTKIILSLLARKKKSFPLKFQDAADLSTVILALLSLRSTKQFAPAIRMYAIELRKLFFLPLSVLRATHKLCG